jgi:hypothetical protein
MTEALDMLRTGLITLALLMLIGRMATTTADPADPQDIAGVYAGEGSNGDGSPYNAIVVIEKYRDAFRVQWIFPTRTQTVGLGILEGDMLAVSYYGPRPGIVLYKVDGTKMVGQWTLVGAGGMLSKETLTRIPADQVPEHMIPAEPAEPQAPRERRERREPRELPPGDGPDLSL